MPKIDFEALTDHELADLITAAAEEWKLRQRQDHKTVVKRNPAMQPKTITVNEPPTDQKQFVLRVKAKVMDGQLVVAAERRGVAAIAADYPAWVSRQGLPREGGAAAWRELAQQVKTGMAQEL